MTGPLSFLSDWWTRRSGGSSVEPNGTGGYFYTMGAGSGLRYGLGSAIEVRATFALCPPLASIVSQKTFVFSKGQIIVWDPSDKKGDRKARKFKPWNDLFLNPNPKQTQRLFTMQGYSNMQMYGYCVIEPRYAIGFEGTTPYRMDVLHNWAIQWGHEIDIETGYPKTAEYTMFGKSRTLDVSKLILIKDSASTEIDEYTGLPLSRSACLEQEANNVIAALDAKGQMVTDRGANGIISNGTKDAIGNVAMTPDEKDQVQQSVTRYGNMSRQDKIIVTNANLSFTPMTFDYQKLGLGEITVDAIKSLCNRYGFPFTNLAEGFEGKYNNSSNGRRDFQDSTIDPESIDFFEQLSLGLGMYKQGCEAYMDYSHVASLQQSKKEQGEGEKAVADALSVEWELGLITRNDAREKLGYERIAGQQDEFDKFRFETASALQTQQNLNQNNQGNEQV